ncbi:MAG: hypothetical protein ACM3W4_12715 [Ignavibacteriales bacterium]
MDMEDHSPEISQLLAAERNIRRSWRFRLFSSFAGTPAWLPASCTLLAGGLIGVASIFAGVQYSSPWTMVAIMFVLIMGLTGLNLWFDKRNIGRIGQRLAPLPAAEVEALRQRFALGGAIASSDRLSLVGAVIMLAICTQVALALYAEGLQFLALIAALFGLGNLVAFRWKVRGWKSQ